MKYIRLMSAFNDKAPVVSAYRVGAYKAASILAGLLWYPSTIDLMGGARWGWASTPKFNLRKREVKS